MENKSFDIDNSNIIMTKKFQTFNETVIDEKTFS